MYIPLRKCLLEFYNKSNESKKKRRLLDYMKKFRESYRIMARSSINCLKAIAMSVKVQKKCL